jgi:hypothetical protein
LISRHAGASRRQKASGPSRAASQAAGGTYAYTDADQTVEVRSLSGQRRATQLGGSTPETLARLMLIELADEGNA